MQTSDLIAVVSIILFFWISFRGGAFGKDRLIVPSRNYRIQMNPFFTRISYEITPDKEKSHIFWRPVEVQW